jgi:hypothetical protein
VRKLTCILAAFTTIVFAQPPAPGAAAGSQAITDAAKQGVALPAQSNATVRDSVSVAAVLLPQNAVRRIFGADVAKTYAVVELVISNHNPDSAFVLHDAYIDTEHWALGGGTQGASARRQDPDTYRAGTYAHQYASVEARLVRGQLLDAQMWTSRNWTMRLLTLAGSLASASTFAFKEQGIVKGIGVFTGDFVPGAAAAWPDGTVAQLNRLSDFGFQTNKVFGKDTADPVVCFFPMDMFLSAPFKGVFLSAPGLFSSPYQILFTPQNAKYRQALSLPDDKDKLKALIGLHQCYSRMFETTPAPKTATATPTLAESVQSKLSSQCETELKDPKNAEGLETLAYIGRFGLQNITVYVNGIMTVDVDSIPATIDGVTFAGDPTQASTWTPKATVNGSLQCRLCQNGTVTVTQTDSKGTVTDLKATTTATSASELDFSFTSPASGISPGDKLTFTITKQPADTSKQAVKSGSYIYTVPAAAAPAAAAPAANRN